MWLNKTSLLTWESNTSGVGVDRCQFNESWVTQSQIQTHQTWILCEWILARCRWRLRCWSLLLLKWWKEKISKVTGDVCLGLYSTILCSFFFFFFFFQSLNNPLLTCRGTVVPSLLCKLVDHLSLYQHLVTLFIIQLFRWVDYDFPRWL